MSAARPPAPPLAARRLSAGLRRTLGALLAVVIVAGTAAGGRQWAWRSGLERLHEAGSHRLDLIAAGLGAELARFDYLPALLDATPAVQALLDDPDDAARRDAANRHLQRLNAAAGAANLYVLDPAGLCVAASDWAEAGTPLGTDLAFRPYVADALRQGRGRFYGVGVTSGRAGQYLSYALQDAGRLRGIATVKLSLEPAQASWRKLPGAVLLFDARGVAVLSSRNEWRYRPIRALDAAARADLPRSRPYGDAPLTPLDWQVLDTWALAEAAEPAERLRLDGSEWLASRRRLAADGWTLVVLDELAPLRASARVAGLASGLVALVVVLLLMLARQRRRARRQRQAAQAAFQIALQTAHDGLERKVGERTAELSATVARLGQEVEARKAIEADLRAAQDELVHAGKLAALGQMAAGLVHELNQPLGALRTLSDNATLLLERQRYPDVAQNLGRIGGLVERLGRLTGQLKAFAHKPQAPGPGAAPAVRPVELRQILAHAQLVLAERLRERGIVLRTHIEPPGLALRADALRLEQVLVNLIGNAVDALADRPDPVIEIEAGLVAGGPSDRGTAAGGGPLVRLRVADNGPGIRADLLPRLFQPFVSSKPAGAGLGLGLMISAQIARECGGRLSAANAAAPASGAVFELHLPAAVDVPPGAPVPALSHPSPEEPAAHG